MKFLLAATLFLIAAPGTLLAGNIINGDNEERWFIIGKQNNQTQSVTLKPKEKFEMKDPMYMISINGSPPAFIKNDKDYYIKDNSIEGIVGPKKPKSK